MFFVWLASLASPPATPRAFCSCSLFPSITCFDMGTFGTGPLGIFFGALVYYSGYQSHAPLNDFFPFEKLIFGGRQ